MNATTQVNEETTPSSWGREELNLGRIYRLLWQRRLLVLGASLVSTALIWLWTLYQVPIYSAEAMVMVESPRMSILNVKEVMSQLTPSHYRLLSEVEVIRSRNLAQRVVEAQKLDQEPLFNPKLMTSAPGFSLRDLVPESLRELLASLRDGLRRAPPPGNLGKTEDDAERERRQLVSRVLSGLVLRPVTQSMVIGIQYNSPDPAMAARLANAFAEQYILDQLESKFDATRRATNWLNQRLDGLRTAVGEAEKAVETYRSQAGLVEKQGERVNQNELSELNTQMILAQAQRAEAEEKLKQFRGAMNSTSGTKAVDEIVNAPLIQRLREQETELMRSISDLSGRYGDKHPKMATLRAEISELRGKIRTEIMGIASSLESRLQVNLAREEALRSNLDRLQKSILDQGQAHIRLRELEREAEASRLLYENFLSRFKETSEQVHIQNADARVISNADPPRSPSYPRVGLFLMAGLLGGGMLGVFLVFFLEQLDNVYRSQEQFEEETGVAAIGMIPMVIGEKESPASYLLDRPSSSYAESLRSLWITLKLARNEPPRVIVITSSLPEEGKTQLSLSLSRAVAALGERVILVDGDLRRPMVRHFSDADPQHHLTDLLAEVCTLEQAVIKDPRSDLHLLLTKAVEHPPLDLLGSERMQRLITTLRERYDLVVIDSPPVMPVSDVRLLARMADRTLFCVKWDSTPREVVKQSLRTLQDSRVSLAGGVITQVNVRKHAHYRYGDSGYYYGRYRKYYAN